jgi:hypothetical protein
VTAEPVAVHLGAAQHLCDEGCDVLRVLRSDLGEDGGEERIARDPGVEHLEELLDAGHAADPLEQGGDSLGLAHPAILNEPIARRPGVRSGTVKEA